MNWIATTPRSAKFVTIAMIISVGTYFIFDMLIGNAATGANVDPVGVFTATTAPSAVDSFNDYLNKARKHPITGDIEPRNAKFLEEFSGSNRQVYLRHLETSAAWFVGEDKSGLFAFRRCVQFGKWVTPMNGFITRVKDESYDQTNDFQIRILLRLQGLASVNADKVVNVDSTPFQLFGIDRGQQQGVESDLIIKSSTASAEFFEQSGAPGRSLTNAAIVELKREFGAVLASKVATSKGFDPEIMPRESVHECTPSLTLLGESFKDHLYHSYFYLNPGESGLIYFKVRNASGMSGVSLIPDGLATNERIGWSQELSEQFFGNLNFRFSSLWAKQLKVRLQVWFTPDSGKPDRMLIERLFSIETIED